MDLGLNQNSISRYESGAREADYKTLIALADYFDVSIDYILERTDKPKMNRYVFSNGGEFYGIKKFGQVLGGTPGGLSD